MTGRSPTEWVTSGAAPAPQVVRWQEPPLTDEVPAELVGLVRKWYIQAAEHHNSGRPDRAAAVLASALMLEPERAALRQALARAQFDAGQLLAARTTFCAMLAIDEEDDFALYGLGLVETRFGNFVRAVDSFACAAALRPADERYSAALIRARVALDEHGPGPEDRLPRRRD
jgi:tetratricopeptide (TPR) repeat protein